MKRSTLDALKVARERRDDARAAYEAVVSRTFKAGDEVCISRGLHNCWATVTARESGRGVFCTSGDDVWVTGKGGAVYRVSAYRIIAHAQHQNGKSTSQ